MFVYFGLSALVHYGDKFATHLTAVLFWFTADCIVENVVVFLNKNSQAYTSPLCSVLVVKVITELNLDSITFIVRLMNSIIQNLEVKIYVL